jgi:hypothetical protein
MTTSVALQLADSETQSLRWRLHAAHAEKQAAEQKLAAAKRALSRGEELVAAAQGEMQRHDDAAKLVAEGNAQRIAAEAQGLPVAAPDDGAEDRARGRQVLEARLADATAARAILQSEANKAKSDVAAAERGIDQAIAALALEAGEQLGRQLLTAETIARDLRLRLVALDQVSHSPVAGQPDRFRLGLGARRALDRLPLNDDRYPQQLPAHLNPISPFAHNWRQTLEALRENADVVLPRSD